MSRVYVKSSSDLATVKVLKITDEITYHLFINMHQLSLVGFMRGKSNHLRTTEVRTHAPIPAAPGRHARAHPRRRRARAHRRRREHDRVSDARARPRI